MNYALIDAQGPRGNNCTFWSYWTLVESKYLKGLDIWFILPGEPIANALIKYCYDKKVHWQDAVRDLLMKALKDEGYL